MNTSADSRALRKQTMETLAMLVERYPNVSIGTIVGSALGDVTDMVYISDKELAGALDRLFVTWSQFEAAGIKP